MLMTERIGQVKSSFPRPGTDSRLRCICETNSHTCRRLHQLATRICALHCKAATCYWLKWRKHFNFNERLKIKNQKLKTVKIQSCWNLNYIIYFPTWQPPCTPGGAARRRSFCSQTLDIPSLFDRFVPERLGSSAWRSPVALGGCPHQPLTALQNAVFCRCYANVLATHSVHRQVSMASAALSFPLWTRHLPRETWIKRLCSFATKEDILKAMLSPDHCIPRFHNSRLIRSWTQTGWRGLHCHN